MTGEKFSVPERDRLSLEGFENIPALIECSTHYTVAQSGQGMEETGP